IDHIISLELGGSNSIRNLFPEPYTGDWNARIKDKLENKLHSLVCSGQVDLVTVQQEISTDWINAYIKYIGQP
ncbi:MAG TPA: HNH endonuclease, partial [Anaerolineae bacterium]|nr:HNH endonuclease [Anaerolineae bacterium]